MEFVYIMKNMANGYYKLGRSNCPEYRERTLQGEEPDVRLLASIPGSHGLERQLQEQFSANRVRGEWFALGYLDLCQLARLFDTDPCTLDPPIRTIEDRHWKAWIYKYSPTNRVTRVLWRGRSEKPIFFSVPYELCTSEIQLEVGALAMGCEVPDEMYDLLQQSLRNYVRDFYAVDSPIIELRELCCLATGNSRGFQVSDKHSGSWYFIRRQEAETVFARLKQCYDVTMSLNEPLHS